MAFVTAGQVHLSTQGQVHQSLRRGPDAVSPFFRVPDSETGLFGQALSRDCPDKLQATTPVETPSHTTVSGGTAKEISGGHERSTAGRRPPIGTGSKLFSEGAHRKCLGVHVVKFIDRACLRK
jgi:hypothetical protein